MKTSQNNVFALLLGLLLFLAGIPSADAAVRIYKVKINAKATYFPVSSFSNVGYLIFDTANPGASQTVQVFAKTKTYQVNGGLAEVISPGALGFFVLDRNNDTIVDIEGATAAFQSANITHTMTYKGAIPKNGFRIGAITLFQTARSLKGTGSVNVGGLDFFTRTETFTIDTLTGANPVSTGAGVALVTAQLAAKGYTQVP